MAMSQRAKVKLDGVGAELIEVDGHDLTKGIWTLDISARPGEIAEMRIGLPMLAGLDIEGDVRVALAPEVIEALTELGWTPPATAPEVVRFWVYTHQDYLDEMRSDPNALPASWTILRALRVPDITSAINRYLVEIADPNAPAAADGKVIQPAVYRRDNERVVIEDYGIPGDSAATVNPVPASENPQD